MKGEEIDLGLDQPDTVDLGLNETPVVSFDAEGNLTPTPAPMLRDPSFNRIVPDMDENEAYNDVDPTTPFDGDDSIDTDAIQKRLLLMIAEQNTLRAAILESRTREEYTVACERWVDWHVEVEMHEIEYLQDFKSQIIQDCKGGEAAFIKGFTVYNEEDNVPGNQSYDEESAFVWAKNNVQHVDYDDPPFCYINWEEVAEYLNVNEDRPELASSFLQDYEYYYESK